MKKKGVFLVLMAVFALICSMGILLCDKDSDIPGVSGEFAVLTDSGFYEKEVRVQVTVPKGAQVYYTTNCEEPTPENGQVFRESVVLSAPEVGEQVHCLRFKAQYADGTWSDCVTKSYIVGQNIANRYTTLVISIIGEPEDLFGYDEGILVPGRRYDEFVKKYPDVHPGSGEVDANYAVRGPESEREVYLEMFDANGKELFAQTGGVRVSGQSSRLNNLKSLRLYARKEYDLENNKFRHDFFGTLTSEKDGTLGQSYKRLLLKNSGQDHAYSFIRSELVGCLADQAGFKDVQHVVPICVYINGQYYGSYWLSSHFDPQYFENKYGAYDGEFVTLEYAEAEKTVSEESTQAEITATREYNAKYNQFVNMDLTVDENYNELEQFMDVENYLQYFAIENYVANADWPDANLKTYRYIAGESGYTEDSVFDGRYRMLLYDADYGFGLTFYGNAIGTLVNEMTLDELLYLKAPLFAGMMEREECRKMFTSYTLDLINGAMRPDNVIAQVDKMHLSRIQELTRTLEVEGLVGGLLLDPNEIGMETVEQNLYYIRSFAVDRPKYVLMDIEEKFGYNQQYQLQVINDTDTAYSRAKVNGVYSEGAEFTGTYLKEIPVTITPCLSPNETFVHWLVNGEVVEEEEIVLEGEAIVGDSIEVRLVTKEADEPVLQIAAVASRGDEDYVELINLSSKPVSTSGYYLSDSEDPWKCQTPGLLLAPGETIRLVGKGNNSPESLGEFGLNFDLKTGETVYLNYNGQTVDSVTLPQLSEDGVYTKDFVRDIYKEQKREQTEE